MEMWKTAALPMENPFTAHGKGQALSHSLQTGFPQRRIHASLHTFPQRLLLRISILSLSYLIKEDNKKRAGVQPIGRTEKLYSRFVLWEVCENQIISLCIRANPAPWENIKTSLQKADTGDFTPHFQPLSVQFLERLER